MLPPIQRLDLSALQFVVLFYRIFFISTLNHDPVHIEPKACLKLFGFDHNCVSTINIKKTAKCKQMASGSDDSAAETELIDTTNYQNG
jgi:hypothetical protein